MRKRADTPASRRRLTPFVGLAVVGASLLSGCSEEVSRGFLPKGATTDAPRVEQLWTMSWIAALVVGCIVWGLTAWCMVAYRRKKGDTGYPVQLRYNVPVEIFYTIVPILMVGVLFYYTARDESALLSTSEKPDVTVNVVGKQWSWDFNYVDANTYEAGTQAQLTGEPGVEQTLPTLWLPVNKRVEFVLTARDVIHSFWVPQFQKKLDMIPGKVNRFQVVPTETGTFKGKCAELCGAYHASMLFNVKVVSQAEYDQHLAQLKAAGNVGQLATDLGREKILPNQKNLLPTPTSQETRP